MTSQAGGGGEGGGGGGHGGGGTFAYSAQTVDGQRVSGTIEAASTDEAMGQLRRLQLRILEFRAASPAEGEGRTAGRSGERSGGRSAAALSSADLLRLNQQLIHLAQTGFPLEAGLRLIAQDMGSGRLTRAVHELASDLEAGVPLAEAMERRRGAFPSAYARVLDAGARSGSLAGVLLSLSRHLELTRRMRQALWQCFAYPALVLATLAGLLLFLVWWVLPGFFKIFREFKVELPEITRMLPVVATVLPIVLLTGLAIVLLPALLRGALKLLGRDTGPADAVLLAMPVVGPILRRSLLAQWCDAVRLGVESGMDLPAAMALGGDACGSSRLARDGARLGEALATGTPLSVVEGLSIIPPTVPAAIAHASASGDLPATMASLSDLYQQQAETRLRAMPGILTPLLLVGVGAFIVYTIIALMMPLIVLIRYFSGSGGM